MKNREPTYNVPASLGLALMSGRAELTVLTINEIKNGKLEVTSELAIEFLRLFMDTATELREARAALEAVGDLPSLHSLLSGEMRLSDASLLMSERAEDLGYYLEDQEERKRAEKVSSPVG